MDLRSIVYCTALTNGSDMEWDFLMERYQSSNVASEKAMIMRALSCSRNRFLLRRYLDYSLNSTIIPKQDMDYVFSGMVQSELGFNIAKEFFHDNINVIHD